MGLIAKDLPTLVFMLLPGFLAAGVFYTLTAHPKSSEFERLIQALIFTAILRVMTTTIRGFMIALGKIVVFGTWTDDIELAWSVVLALPVGLIFAYLANYDIFHKFLRRKGVTSSTSYPSQWYSAFAREKRWVILHLTDGRRLSGWPKEWPDQPDKGHFVLDDPAWVLADNDRAPLYQVERFMIPAVDVKMVEFLKADEEVTQPPSELDRIDHLLIDAHKEQSDGSESPTADPEPPQEATGGD
jgi:hypothetical protein